MIIFVRKSIKENKMDYTIKNLAILAHRRQKYGEKPYIYHLDSVANIVNSVYKESEYIDGLLCLTYLHDSFEDNNQDEIDAIKNIIQEIYIAPDEIIETIELISDCKGKNRKERKQKTNEKFSLLDPSNISHWLVLVIKSADRFANIIECVNTRNADKYFMYKGEHKEFKKAVYRDAIPEIKHWWQEMDSLLNQSFFCNTIREDFLD